MGNGMNGSYLRKSKAAFCIKSGFITLFIFAFSSSARAVNAHLFLHPNLPKDVQTATRLERLSSSRVLHLTVSLPARNQTTMNVLVQAMYERKNPQYHRYLTP